MRTITIGVPSFSEVKDAVLRTKDEAVALGKDIVANPEAVANATKDHVTSGRFVAGLTAGLLAAVAIKSIVS